MTYIGLLRAVNVGGKNTVKMAELRSALEAVDLQQVRTYFQSGNIVFDSELPEEAVQQRIEYLIAQRFGFHVDVIVRSLLEFDRLVTTCPFIDPTSSSTPAGLAVAFLNTSPDQDAVAALAPYVEAGEQYQVVGRDVYVLLPHGTARSKLAAQVQKMGPTATLRNWKTVQKLHALADDHRDDPD